MMRPDCRLPALTAVLLLLIGCSDPEPEPGVAMTPGAAETGAATHATDPGQGARAPAEASQPAFAEQAQQLGVEHHYQNGLSDRFHIVETIGGGVAVIDYDLDGDLDLYLPQGGDPHQRPAHPVGDRLLRNTLIEDGVFAFVDASASTGIEETGFALGVTFGDPNGDGLPDLYVSNYGPNSLLLNQGDGRFVSAAQDLGVADSGMGTGAVFFDYDRDGDEDLFVANYVVGAPEPKACWGRDSLRDYCSPKSWQPAANRMFRNDGERFAEVTAELGMDADPRTSFQVLPLDVDQDGWLDLLIANDGMENRLWVNQRGERFVDRGAEFGLAVNLAGVAEASMGVDIADVDGDGRVDIFMTHLRGESNTLYRQLNANAFLDGSAGLGLAGSDLPYTGWGVRWADFNLDSWPDLFVVNGAESIGNRARPEDLNEAMAQPNLAYRNADGRLVAIGEQMPEAWRAPSNSRGLASGDLNNDGAIDLVAVHAGQLAQLFINQAQMPTWIGLELRQANGPWPRHPVRVRHLGETPADAMSMPLGGFLSVSSPRVLMGLGDTAANQPISVEIDWGGGQLQRVDDLAAQRFHLIRQDQAARQP